MSEKDIKQKTFQNFDMNRNLDTVFEDPREDRTTTQLETSGASLISQKQPFGQGSITIDNKERNTSKDVNQPLLVKTQRSEKLPMIK